MAQAAHRVLQKFCVGKIDRELLQERPSGITVTRSSEWHCGPLLQAFVGPCLSDDAFMHCANVNNTFRRKAATVSRVRACVRQ